MGLVRLGYLTELRRGEPMFEGLCHAEHGASGRITWRRAVSMGHASADPRSGTVGVPS